MNVNKKIITPKNMVIEDTQNNLSDWLIASAIFGKHRGMENKLKELDDLIQMAWRTLGDEEYTRIYKRTVKETTGEEV